MAEEFEKILQEIKDKARVGDIRGVSVSLERLKKLGVGKMEIARLLPKDVQSIIRGD